jgi:hypothetical protein
LAYLAFLPALGLMPYFVRPPGSVASAATAQGYNTTLAYALAVLVSLSTVAVFAIQERRNPSPRPAQERSALPQTASRPWVEPLLVFAVFAILYFPGFLARYGPYNEDNYFLTVLHRMNSGLRPYRDFEFPYGPLMVYTAHGWMLLFGYSMRSYYGLLCLMEALQFSALILALRRWFPSLRTRMLLFGFLTVFLFDTLLGMNWNGLRRLLPVAAILCTASVPHSRWRLLAGAALCGLSTAYSPDLGVPCILAALSIHALGFLRTRDFNCIGRACLLLLASLTVWLAVVSLLLGKTLAVYLKTALYVMQRFGSGEAGFPFYWTLNSLAAFALLSLCCVAVGRGLGNRSALPLLSGDLLFFASVCFAIVGLRSGLNRADMWHLNAPLLPLFFAFIAPWPRSLFRLSRLSHRAAVVILLVLCVSYIPGVLPSASFYLAGWARGLRDSIQGRGLPSTGAVSRAPIIEPERSHPESGVLALASDLAKDRQPVVFYGEAWATDKRVGVYKSGFATDDALLDDAAGERIRQVLEARGALAVLTRDEYLWVYGTDDAAAPAPTPFYSHTPVKALASWISTVHFRAVEIERRVRQARWYRTVGWYLRSCYVLAGDYGEFVLLAPVKHR